MKKVYTEKDIKVIEGLAHVRARPKMYLGTVDEKGWALLIKEVLADLIQPSFRLESDGNLVIEAQGPEISVEKHPKLNRPLIEVYFTVIGTGPRTTAEQNCLLGMFPILNALSSYLKVEIFRNNKIHCWSFEKGVATSSEILEASAQAPAWKLSFKPDSEISGNLDLKQLTALIFEL